MVSKKNEKTKDEKQGEEVKENEKVKRNEDEKTEEKSAGDNYKALKSIIETLDIDFSKFQHKKVKACGARVRNNLLNVKKLCDMLRKQILFDIKEIPTKHRKTTE